MNTYASLLPFLVPELPGAHQYYLTQQLTAVARDFCVRSEAYYADLTAIDIVAAQTDYTLTAPAAADIVKVASVEVDEVGLSQDDYSVVQVATWTLTLQATPTAASTGGLVVTVILQPAVDATELPEYLVERWYLAIVAGVKARMMRQTRKPWSDPAEAAASLREYHRGIALARNLTAKGYRHANLSLQIPDFV